MFVGRKQDLAVFDTAFSRAKSGEGSIILVQGEAGIGKTRLVAEALQRARKRGLTTVVGAGDELERDRPFGAVIDALRGELPNMAELSSLTSAHQTREHEDWGDPGYPIIEAVVSGLEARTGDAPVVFAVDDAHWADLPTLRLVSALAGSVATLPLILVTAFQPVPTNPELQGLITRLSKNGDNFISLGPLSDADVEQLAEEVMGARPGPLLTDSLKRAGGNPLFVTELVRGLDDEGLIERADEAELREEQIPESLHVTISRRLRVLPDDAIDVLKVTSLLGSTFSAKDVAAVTGRKMIELMTVFDDAIQAGILDDTGTELTFHHDLVRQTLRESMPVSVRKGLHREIGLALADAGAPAGRVAEHITLGAEPGDAEAIRWLREAAADASSRSMEVAVSLSERALALTGDQDGQRAALISNLLVPLVLLGRASEAEDLAREALDTSPDPTTEHWLRLGLASALAYLSRANEAMREFERAAAAAAEGSEERAICLAEASRVSLLAEPESAAAAAQVAAAAAASCGSQHALAVSLAASSLAAEFRGDLEEAVELGSRSVSLWTPASTARSAFLGPHLSLGISLAASDRLEDALSALHAGRTLAEQRGNQALLPGLLVSLAGLAFVAGAFDDALAHIETLLATLTETGLRTAVVLANTIAAGVHLHRGRFPDAEAALERAQTAFETAGDQFGVDWMLWVRGLHAEVIGDTDRALILIHNAWTVGTPRRFQFGYRMMAPDLVRLAVSSDRDLAETVTEAVEDGARRTDAATATGAALRCRGLLEDDPDILCDAVAAYRRGPRPIELALTCEDAASALAHTGREPEAVSLLEEAGKIYEPVTASHDLARVHAALRALGVSRRRSSRPRRATAGWEALTETELAVVNLVLEGLTSREIGDRLFISRRTVDTHLSHVFTKLGVHTRAAVAAEAGRHIDPGT